MLMRDSYHMGSLRVSAKPPFTGPHKAIEEKCIGGDLPRLPSRGGRDRRTNCQQALCKVLRKCALPLRTLATGERQPKARRMEKLSVKPRHRTATIKAITRYRAANGGKVHSNLVRTTGVKASEREGMLRQCLQCFILGNRRASSAHHCHFQTVSGMPANRCFDSCGRRIEGATTQQSVLLEHPAVVHRNLEIT